MKLTTAFIAFFVGVLYFALMYGLTNPIPAYICAVVFFILLTAFFFMKEPNDLI